MTLIARLLLLLCLLPGLITGTLPLPGQAAGMEMVICADGGPVTVRLGADGTPVAPDDCDQCCIACGQAVCLLPEGYASVHPAWLNALALALPALPDLPPARAFLFPGPRGPPMAV